MSESRLECGVSLILEAGRDGPAGPPHRSIKALEPLWMTSDEVQECRKTLRSRKEPDLTRSDRFAVKK